MQYATLAECSRNECFEKKCINGKMFKQFFFILNQKLNKFYDYATKEKISVPRVILDKPQDKINELYKKLKLDILVYLKHYSFK